jgi:hypothetical protein
MGSTHRNCLKLMCSVILQRFKIRKPDPTPNHLSVHSFITKQVAASIVQQWNAKYARYCHRFDIYNSQWPWKAAVYPWLEMSWYNQTI